MSAYIYLSIFKLSSILLPFPTFSKLDRKNKGAPEFIQHAKRSEFLKVVNQK